MAPAITVNTLLQTSAILVFLFRVFPIPYLPTKLLPKTSAPCILGFKNIVQLAKLCITGLFPFLVKFNTSNAWKLASAKLPVLSSVSSQTAILPAASIAGLTSPNKSHNFTKASNGIDVIFLIVERDCFISLLYNCLTKSSVSVTVVTTLLYPVTIPARLNSI